MGNYVNLMVIAPSVTRDDVERLATRAREVMRYSATVILCDLVGKRVRKESLVKARDAGLRILDLDVARDVDRLALRVLAAEHLGKDAFSSAEAALSFGEVRIDAHCWGVKTEVNTIYRQKSHQKTNTHAGTEMQSAEAIGTP